MKGTFNDIIYDTETDERLLSWKYETLCRTATGQYYFYNKGIFIDRGFEAVIRYTDEKKNEREWISIIPSMEELIEILIEEYISK